MKEYLQDRYFEELQWNGPFHFPGLVRVQTIADGSCFFHAIAHAFFDAYRTGLVNGQAVSRTQIVHGFRLDLADALSGPADLSNLSGPTRYDLLGGGTVKEIAAAGMEEYSLGRMQAELRDTHSDVGYAYNELISDFIDKDIYILNGMTEDVYPTGGDETLLYKNRNSIVLHHLPGHFELVGLVGPNGIQTTFPPESEFIQTIRGRLQSLKG